MKQRARMLRTALGPAIVQLLEGRGVVEIMLNPDRRLWADCLAEDRGEIDDSGGLVVSQIVDFITEAPRSAFQRKSSETQQFQYLSNRY